MPATAYTPTTTQPITNYIPVLLTAASGVARFDHNPTTGESLGLLVEEQRSNLVTYSDDFADASWVKSDLTVTANTIVAPDGMLTGDKIVSSGSGSPTFQGLAQTVSALAAESRFSVYLKAAEITQAELRVFGGVTPTIVIVDVSTQTFVSGSGTIENVGNGWYRVAVSALAGNTSFRVSLAKNGNRTFAADGYSGIYIWGAQLEEGAFPTSYIPTVAATVTRNADAASMTGANFTSWFNNAEGTLYAEANKPAALASAIVFSANDNSSNNRQSFVYVTATSLRYRSITNNVTDGAITVTVGADAYVKSAGAYKVNDFAYSANAGSAGTDTSALVPVVSQLNIGSEFNASTYLNGTIKKLAYYPIRATNAQLQALTS
jgi:hypothetical protein